MNPYLVARLPVGQLAEDAVRDVSRALGEYNAVVGARPKHLQASAERIAAAFRSEQFFQWQGKPVSAFAPHSGFFRTVDGWVRTHANYPHHRGRLLTALGLPDRADRDSLARELRRRESAEIESAAVDAGAIAVQVRPESVWRTSPQGSVAADVQSRRRDDQLRAPSLNGLAGLRVVDMTRVIAGPVCTRTLALLGATVLRIDPPHMPEIGWQHLDTGQGKFSTVADLRTHADRHAVAEIISAADVLVTGYRPGSLAVFDLPCVPGMVRAEISAWGWHGPWRMRRGFDSIVQAASGISLIESADGATPGALPAQALDHASGYFLAAEIIRALTQRLEDGHGRDVMVSLAGTANRLLDLPGRQTERGFQAAPPQSTTIAHGDCVYARPVFTEFSDYRWPARPWGKDALSWPAVTGPER
ncbi:CoA transferase [Hoyosella subflava]|uniref:Carnitine dehydratase n=1 Tax=Hoyosella subflava (strain DSM 45089 / JCM 17490 / NBRC 109087 / DQS3-9A1) TaxID=443218 RepID=F6ENC3_HOYSD|nr:CoA transferase [Hoyosella subflava]AEF40394.1 Carnitine dehydratase [Hoyosella subflava DQS3-9A1]